MKFQEILFDILGEAILPHYTGRKARVGDDYDLVLDLNLFANEQNFGNFLEEIGLSSEKEEIIKNRYKEVPTSFKVGSIELSESEKNLIINRLNQIEKDDMYKKVYKKYVEDNSEPSALIVKVHSFTSLGEKKINDLINSGNYENDIMHFLVLEAFKYVNKPGREEYLIRKYKIKDDKPSNLINLYFRNHPIVSDFGKIEDEGSIGGVVTVVIRDDSKERRGDNPPDINLVTLINDRSTRMYKRHLSEGSAVISWDEFEALKNKVSPQTKPDILSKSDVGIERIKEKREKSQKRYVNFLRVIANDGQSANELESYFNQYYDMMDDLNNTSNENIKKKTSEISSLRFKIFNLIDTTNRRTQNKTYDQKKGDVEKIMNAFDPKSWKTELQTYFTNTWEKFWK